MGRVWYMYEDGSSPTVWPLYSNPSGLSSLSAAFINQFVGWQRYICNLLGAEAPIDKYFQDYPEQGQADLNGKKWVYPHLTNIQDRFLYNALRFSPPGSNWLTNWRQDSEVGDIVEDWNATLDEFPVVDEIQYGDIVHPAHMAGWFASLRLFIDSMRAVLIDVEWPEDTGPYWRIWENFTSPPSGNVQETVDFTYPYAVDRMRWDGPSLPQSTEGRRPYSIIVPRFTPLSGEMRTVVVSHSVFNNSWFNDSVHIAPQFDCYIEAETTDPITDEGWDVTSILPDYTPELSVPDPNETNQDYQYTLNYSVVSVMPDSLPDEFKPSW
jgi:hypothetical protein